jgi:double-stranded uracil-DNA glycosylase
VNLLRDAGSIPAASIRLAAIAASAAMAFFIRPFDRQQDICQKGRRMKRTLPTPWKPTKAQLLAARSKRVSDLIRKDLTVLFVGINPGLYTAAIGRHFGRPGNRFWPALYAGGFTPRLFSPFESALLLDLNLGITNVVSRATVRADELTNEEIRAGGKRLEAKVKRWRPTVTAFVGIGPYRIISGIKDAGVGLQKDLFGGSHAWVLPNPSGLNAHYQPAALAKLFEDLRLWAFAKHKRRGSNRHIR